MLETDWISFPVSRGMRQQQVSHFVIIIKKMGGWMNIEDLKEMCACGRACVRVHES